ncbi:MAG: M1 family aminopeptidase, partial [Nitrospirae bacterium]|nr:M1 family aminopeptidase [Nitrospirota bacterium]
EHSLTFELNPKLTVQEVTLGGQILSVEKQVGGEDFSLTQKWMVRIPESLQTSSSGELTITYQGAINDPPQASKGLRFVRPDKTNGYIGNDGVYLTSETVYYPILDQRDQGLLTFQVRVIVPHGWEVVTQGQEISRSQGQNTVITEWNVPIPSEALTLAANQFVKHQREWNGHDLQTFLFPDDAALAPQYLDATHTYLEFYTALFGPYPFTKFAVVENFFPSGIGLPSFTLLGNRVIKRGYTQPYSLGHEIVHSWLGNSVYNDFSTGNWVEGLTTYLANYYFEEVHADPGKAEALRRKMIFEYSLYASPDVEYPLTQFHHKETRIDNAIGYQKAAMVFHMLRREIGDQAFFSGIRQVVKEGTGRYMNWPELEQVFGGEAGRDLKWFFQQWVTQTGAPTLNILSAKVLSDSKGLKPFTVEATMSQSGVVYRQTLQVMIEFEDGSVETIPFLLKNETQIFRAQVSNRPITLSLDPTFDSFRRLPREQMPPLLNGWTTAKSRKVLLPQHLSDTGKAAFHPIVNRLRAQGTVEIQEYGNHPTMASESILLLASPQDHPLVARMVKGCGDSIVFGDGNVTIDGKRFSGENMAFLFSCPNPQAPGQVVSVLSGFSYEAIQRMSRLLFFYGWDSYLVFEDGVVVDRGMFRAPRNSLKVLLSAA